MGIGTLGRLASLGIGMFSGMPILGAASGKVIARGIDRWGQPDTGIQRERFGQPQMQVQGQGLAPQLFGPSTFDFSQPGFGPYASGYQMPSSPSLMQQAGIPAQQTSYGMTLPNLPSSAPSAGGGFGSGGGGGLASSGGGGLGMGNVGMLGTTRRYGAIRHS